MTSSSAEIDPGEWLFRRVFPGNWVPESDRPFSNCFEIDTARESGLSVYRASLCSPGDVLEGHAGFGLIRLRAEEFLSRGLSVVSSPVADEESPRRGAAHAEVVSDYPSSQIPRAVRRALADVAGLADHVIVRPSGV